MSYDKYTKLKEAVKTVAEDKRRAYGLVKPEYSALKTKVLEALLANSENETVFIYHDGVKTYDGQDNTIEPGLNKVQLPFEKMPHVIHQILKENPDLGFEPSRTWNKLGYGEVYDSGWLYMKSPE